MYTIQTMKISQKEYNKINRILNSLLQRINFIDIWKYKQKKQILERNREREKVKYGN